MKDINKRTICADGTSLSIQASKYHYSEPREDMGPYWKVEVGFIEDAEQKAITPPETWREHGDGDFPSDVYGYVPVKLVQEFIAAHGGRVDGGEMPECE